MPALRGAAAAPHGCSPRRAPASHVVCGTWTCEWSLLHGRRKSGATEPAKLSPRRVGAGCIVIQVSVHAIAPPATILVAGIGNVFLGDDAFGVRVIERLAKRV